MLVLSSKFISTPILSLQTGTRIAQTVRPLVDPGTLSISAFEVDGPLLVENPSFLRVNEIREIGSMGMIVDSSDDIVGLDDVIRLKQLYDLHFNLIGMPVITEHKQKLGKVEEFTMESGSFVIQQLQVKRGIFHGLTDTGLLIHRSQVVSITDNEVIVKSTAKKTHNPIMEATRHDFANPFRKPSTQAETTEVA